MGILATLRRLFASPVSRAPLVPGIPRTDVEGPGACEQLVAPNAQIPQVGVGATAFVPSFKPFKPERKNTEWVEKKQQEEWEEFGDVLTHSTYRYGYLERDTDGYFTGRFKEMFRSEVEGEWAEAFDELGLQWEYEPLKFAMGPKHFSYTPDFKVAGFSIPDSKRPLYIEVKWFGEDMNLSKYVRFTEWYNCDLLVLAHYDRDLWQRAKRWKKRPRPNVLKPEKHRYYLILRCTHCDNYIDFPSEELPAEDYQPPNLVQRWQYDSSVWGRESCVCEGKPIERIVVPDDFLIQAGTIGRGRVVLPDATSSGRQISYICP